MAKSKGWIKVERDILDHWVFQDAEYFRAWMLILLMANHEDTKILINKVPTLIPRGAFHSSIVILAGKLGWTRKRTTRYIEMLEMNEMLTTKRTTHGTTFFVENYGKYQGQGTTKGTADDTARDTAEGTARDTQTRIYKNDKEGKEARTRSKPKFKTLEEKFAELERTTAELKRRDEEDAKRRSTGSV